MKVILSPRAEKYLKKLNKIGQLAIASKIRKIASSPNLEEEKILRGYRNIFRIRIADYRIVYRRQKNETHIILIGHRKDIYKLFTRLLN